MLLQTGEKSRGGHPITPKRFQKRSIPNKKKSNILFPSLRSPLKQIQRASQVSGQGMYPSLPHIQIIIIMSSNARQRKTRPRTTFVSG